MNGCPDAKHSGLVFGGLRDTQLFPSRSIPEQEKRLQALWNACEKLPKANYNNIR